jgi:hypothetical protein
MSKNAVSVGAGVVMTAVGLVLYLAFADVETPVIGLRQVGLVLLVLGVVELLVTAFTMARPKHR